MTDNKRAETPRESPAPLLQCQANHTAPSKWRTTLTKLLEGPQHRFQAEEWGDHALHSTVASLRRNHGLAFDREWREVPTRFGKPCRVKAYWVNFASESKARAILAGTRKHVDSEVPG